MKRKILLTWLLGAAIFAHASTTLPLQGTVVKPTDKHIQYVGRICFDHPDRPRFTFPGAQINVCFTGTSVKLWVKPKSGYFMAQIDQAEPYPAADVCHRGL